MEKNPFGNRIVRSLILAAIAAVTTITGDLQGWSDVGPVLTIVLPIIIGAGGFLVEFLRDKINIQKASRSKR